MTQGFELPQRVWARIDKRGEDECWEWSASRDQKRYGLVRFNRVVIRVPRLMLISLGYDMENKITRHRCDNPPCCNPKHLIPGTRFDNVQDCIQRGRRAAPRKGTDNNKARLSENEVLQIRQAYEALPKSPGGYSAKGEAKNIARRFGIGYVHLNLIVNRKLWKHI